jgi:hypothetical protein
MAHVTLDTSAITGWESFHAVSKETFGFPDFYGRNMDAWHDCLTYLNDGMSRFNLPADEMLTIEVRGTHDFFERVPALASALVDAVAFVNVRNLEAGEKARLLLLLA